MQRTERVHRNGFEAFTKTHQAMKKRNDAYKKPHEWATTTLYNEESVRSAVHGVGGGGEGDK